MDQKTDINDKVNELFERTTQITNKKPIDIAALEMILKEIRELRNSLKPTTF